MTQHKEKKLVSYTRNLNHLQLRDGTMRSSFILNDGSLFKYNDTTIKVIDEMVKD